MLALELSILFKGTIIFEAVELWEKFYLLEETALTIFFTIYIYSYHCFLKHILNAYINYDR